MSRINNSIKTESRLVIVSDWRWGIGKWLLNVYRVSFVGNENILELVELVAQHCEYAKKKTKKNHWVIYFKMVKMVGFISIKKKI